VSGLVKELRVYGLRLRALPAANWRAKQVSLGVRRRTSQRAQKGILRHQLPRMCPTEWSTFLVVEIEVGIGVRPPKCYAMIMAIVLNGRTAGTTRPPRKPDGGVILRLRGIWPE
jgi:hypothetical protein